MDATYTKCKSLESHLFESLEIASHGRFIPFLNLFEITLTLRHALDRFDRIIVTHFAATKTRSQCSAGALVTEMEYVVPGHQLPGNKSGSPMHSLNAERMSSFSTSNTRAAKGSAPTRSA